VRLNPPPQGIGWYLFDKYNLTVITVVRHRIASLAVWHPDSGIFFTSTMAKATKTKSFMAPQVSWSQFCESVLAIIYGHNLLQVKLKFY
jgi:hypothetical protein